MKRKNNILILLPLITLSLSSCNFESRNYIKGEEIVKENLTNNEFTLKEFEGEVFKFDGYLTKTDGGRIFRDSVESLFVADVNKDGYRDFCATLKDMSSTYIAICDYKNMKQLFTLESAFYDLKLKLDESNFLMCLGYDSFEHDAFKDKGYLTFINNEIGVSWIKETFKTKELDYKLYLYENGELLELEKVGEGIQNKYVVNSFSTFALKVSSKNNHNEELFFEELKINSYISANYISSFKAEDGSRMFLFSFDENRNIQKVELNLLDIDFEINFMVDNKNKCWDKYKLKMSDVFTYLNELNSNNVKKVSFEPTPGSIAPGSLYEIYYSSDIKVINEFLRIKKFDIFKMDCSTNPAPGGGQTHYNFYTDNKKVTLTLDYGTFRYGGNDYLPMDHVDSSIIRDNSETFYKMKIYGDYTEVIEFKDPSKKFFIDFYDQIEFIEWPENEPYEEIEPKYLIKDIKATSNEDRIYTPNRFSIFNGDEEKMYKVTSEIDFSSIF